MNLRKVFRRLSGAGLRLAIVTNLLVTSGGPVRAAMPHALAPAAAPLSAALAASEPAPAAAEPLMVVKSQSAFVAGGLLAVTYTLRNRLSPVARPVVAPGADVTTTINAIQATDFDADANTIRGAVLALTLAGPQAEFHSASLPVERDGAALAFNLGDVPPLGEASVVVTVTTPAAAADFTNLDSGASANGAWRGRAVYAQAGPIRIAPDGFDAWLVCTPDANCADPVVQRQAAALGHDPDALFSFVRGLNYESYIGSLRGARGTLWSAAGNGHDQASALIALLRASGIPAAYRLGTLGHGAAQDLIGSMFPPVASASGLISAGVETADPVNDAALIAEAQAHAWVEAYLPGNGWTALDPSFDNATAGQVFGSPTGGQLAELPDNVRHKVTLALEVEKYGAFPVGGTNLYRIHPLTATLNTVALVGEPVVFAHLVESETPGGLVFASSIHNYIPYFVVGDTQTLVEGQAFGEVITTFPFGQDMVVGEWLNLTTTDPNGNSETYRRELFDDIGYAVRTQGGLVGEMARDETARLSLMSSWTTLFSPSAVPLEALNDTYQDMVALSLEGIAASEAIEGVADTLNPTPEQVALGQSTAATYGELARLAQRQHLLQYAAASDQAHDALASSLLVRAYPSVPRVFTVGWERDDTTQSDTISFDLGLNQLRALAYPGQTATGVEAFNFWRGLLDMSIEHELLAAIAPEPVVSVAAVFNQAIAEDIPLERITPGTLDELQALPLSDQAKARISTALADNPDLYVLVPAEMVSLPGASEPTVGWLQVDQNTLEVVDVMENGQHMVAVNYAALAQFSQKIGSFLGGFTAGFFSYVMGFWVGFFSAMPLGSQDIEAVIAASKASAEAFGNEADKACVKKSDTKWCKRGVSAGNALGAAILGDDPPLQEALFNLPAEAPETSAQASATVAGSATLGGSSISADLTTPLVGVHGSAGYAWTTNANTSFAFSQLTAGAAQLYSGATLLASGAVTATPTGPGLALAVAGSGVLVNGSASGALALHAPALEDLAAGSQWDDYAFELTAAGSYSLTLSGASVSVNGANYSGDLVLVTSGAAAVVGEGATAAPNFSSAVTVEAAGAGFIVAPASGSLTVGGSPAPAGNGFALGSANGTAASAPDSATHDSFTFSGSADFFAVALTSNASTIPGNGVVAFHVDLAANFASSYTLTVFAPDGWDVSVNGAGAVTAVPPLGAAAGDYALIVTAEPSAYPGLFASADHVVSLTAVHGVQVTVAPDPLFTVPWGPSGSVINFDPAVGRVQLSGAAFAATITNASSVARTFDVDVAGLPGGWAIVGGEPGNTTLSLPMAAGEVVRLGVYISPTVSSLPAPGTLYPFDVTATAQDNGGIQASDDGLFTMPSVAYPALHVDPAEMAVASNSQAAFEFTLTNIGNAAGDFHLSEGLPAAGWGLVGLQSPVSLAAGASASQLLTVSVTTGKAGVDYPVAISAAAPGLPYNPTTAVLVYVYGPLASPVFQASVRIDAECAPNWDNLSATLETLSLAMSDMESTCDDGACSLTLRDAVVAALESVAFYARAASPLITTADAFELIAADMAGHTANVDLEADLAAIGGATQALSDEVCEICQHQPAVRWSPTYNAGLPGQPVSYTLRVENQGTLTTTYAVTATLPSGTVTFTPTLAAGSVVSYGVAASAAPLGLHDLTGQATATGPDVTLPDLTASATARLNVVDRFVQVTAVNADPAFVETGVSSTTLSVDVTNVANVLRPVTARTEIVAPAGGISHTADMALNLLVGAPRTYGLGTVDTSDWAEGVYTVTVDLLDDAEALVPDGSGYGYFGVGQALAASHSVAPLVVAPGAITVTTVITTVLEAEPVFPEPEASVPPGDGVAHLLLDGGTPVGAMVSPGKPRFAPVGLPQSESPAAALAMTAGLTRTEQNDAAITYSGTWSSLNSGLVSGGNYYRADDLGDTAVFTYTGAWLNLGFLGGPNSGQAEVFIDGVSQGAIDLYRREDSPLSFVYDNFIAGTHVLSVTVLNTSHANAGNDHVQLDYVDVWDGTPLPDGSFEQDDARVYLSSGWSNVNDADASGGSYVRSTAATAWFIFTGDSVSYQALAHNGGGRARVYLDGHYLATQPLYAAADITRTLSFAGLTTGPHVLQVSAHFDETTLDAFVTPGVAPFHTPSAPAGFTRYEDDDPALLYNGLPLTVTSQSWGRSNPNALISGWASQGQWVGSDSPGDTVSLTFDGVWVSVGFSGQETSGLAEIFIDGVSQGIVDLYRNEPDAISFSYGGLLTGTHTISVSVLASANPLANGDEVRLDYIDVWDGTPLASGAFEQDDARVLRSSNWTEANNGDASGGSYMINASNSSAWFAFTEDSITVQAFEASNAEKMELRLDGEYVTYADIHTNASPTHTFSFDGLGPGVHILQVRQYRDAATLDAVFAPANGTPAVPASSAFTRYEEDHPAILYNGLPYTVSARSWDRFHNTTYVSDGQYYAADSDGDWLSFDFSGTWVRAGFQTGASGGQVEVFIDGASQGVLDLYTRDDGVTAATYGGLADASHTISMTLLSTQHPNANGNRLTLDYFDTWDGTPLAPAVYEDDDPLVWRSSTGDDWTPVALAGASGGSYLSRSGLSQAGSLWFAFTGESVAYQGVAANNVGARVELLIDDTSRGIFNMYNRPAITRAFSFDGLGAGPHVLEVRYYHGPPTLDAISLPGTAPFYQTPVYTGIVRYEEDHAEMRYAGYDWTQRPIAWTSQLNAAQVSGSRHASSSTLSQTVSLTFDGVWVSAGFRGVNNTSQARIFIDGVDQGLVDMDTGGENVISFAYGGLVTGTHSISVSVAAGTVYFDYFDVWDGLPMSDDFQNARLAVDNSRLHYGSGLVDDTNAFAAEGDYLRASLLNTNASAWYSFVGSSFTLIALSLVGPGSVDVYVDGMYSATVDLDYPFSQKPFAVHFSGLDDGPHTVVVRNVLNMRLDGFASNPGSLTAYEPRAEWWDNTVSGNGPWGGIITPIAAGDINGDGLVELVVSVADVANSGTLAVLRGDGQDAGGGNPVLWTVPYNINPIPFEHMGAPAIADLDGLPGAEIVLPNTQGLHVYHADGTPYWHTSTLKSHVFFGAPAIGNLDLEPLPEVVVNLGDTLAVFEHDGSLAWSVSSVEGYFNPVLADLTGDGLLDILVTDGDDTLYLWDYNLGTPQLVWSVPFGSQISVYGGPAVADIDGQQPGGGPDPEIAVAISGTLHVLNADGTSLWSAPLGAGRPGGVSIADLDGDGEVEILTSTEYDGGRLVAYNADGSLLWDIAAVDNSPANASLMDLDGDGAYEVAWVGPPGQGFHLFNGADGSLLFHEPAVFSLTGLDYPIFADVDLDGYGEVVVPAQQGPRVFGWDGQWTEARPLWNQPSYHITNINDDLSVPVSELNSWETHNTFRTQWPDSVVLPVYDVSLAHTVGGAGVAVLAGTFNVTPTLSADPLYLWEYAQTPADAVITRTFDSALTDLQPGEARMVAEGTVVTYTLPGGTNTLTLPPLYVSVEHIIAIAPQAQSVGAGGVVTYAVGLSNPAAASDSYTLTVSGVPEGWAMLPANVALDAQDEVTVTLTISVPAGTLPGELPVVVSAVNQAGGSDQVQAELTVIDALDVALSPATQAAETRQAAAYTLTVTNHEAQARTYDLSAFGLADVTLPPTVMVPASSSAQVVVLATAAVEGPHPFTVLAGFGGASESASAQLVASGLRAVGLDLDPQSNAAGPGSVANYVLTVTNLGSLADGYDLSLDLPSGWMATLDVNGAPVSAVVLPPDLFNSAEVRLAVTPALAATPGAYEIGVTAQSQIVPGVTAEVTATLEVLARGVQVSVNPGSQTVNPAGGGQWEVTVTNTGSVADVYDLTAAGIASLSGQFSNAAVALAAGQSTVVNLAASQFGFLAPGSYPLAVAAVSQADDRVQSEAMATVVIGALADLEISLTPASQTVPGQTASLMLVITNAGNVGVTYALSLDMPGLSGTLGNTELVLPAFASAMLLLEVGAALPGTYGIEAVADSISGPAASGSATASVTFEFDVTEPPPALLPVLYLPIVSNQPSGLPALDFMLYLPIVASE